MGSASAALLLSSSRRYLLNNRHLCREKASSFTFARRSFSTFERSNNNNNMKFWSRSAAAALTSATMLAMGTLVIPNYVNAEAVPSSENDEICPIDEQSKVYDSIEYIDLENKQQQSTSLGVIHGYSVATYAANAPMEDRYAIDVESSTSEGYIAVFDGHGGWQVSEYVKTNLIPTLKAEMAAMRHKCTEEQVCETNGVDKAITRGFDRTDRDLLGHVRQSFDVGFGQVAKVGSCGLLVHIIDYKAEEGGDDKKTLRVANAGDCRVVLATESTSGNGKVLATALSRDHNAREPEEKRRLAEAHPGENDIVKCKSPTACYVKGRLQPTRSFGDFYLKHSELNGPEYSNGDRSRGRHVPAPYTPPYITASPELTTRVLTQSDRFLILGSDGVWDFLENQEAVDIVQKAIDDGVPDLASRKLVQTILERSAEKSRMSLEDLISLPAGRNRRVRHDDTTVVVVHLQAPAKE